MGSGSANPVILISDDGVPFEMCDIGNGSVTASQSQPANLYAQYALTYAVDAAKGVELRGRPARRRRARPCRTSPTRATPTSPTRSSRRS